MSLLELQKALRARSEHELRLDAMTRVAALFANRARAICSIIRPWVRSDMPMATAPLPMISTSPPSSEERPKSSTLKRSSSPVGGYQNSNPPSANIGCAL